jgi:4-hydroxy-3-methylbut-2-enyl diphosphate reductase
VHNDEEIARLEAKGLKIIDLEKMAALRNEKVLIRAHGEPPSTYKMALENNIELIDASCPVVLKLQNRIRSSFQKGQPIYIYGKHGHAEVLGLVGQTEGQAVVFQDWGEVDAARLPTQITLFSQTTKSTENFYENVRKLREAGAEVEAHDTICRQVSHRDTELRQFAARFDRVLFVSGAKSSNGRVLFGVCQEANQNTHFVSRLEDLQQISIQAGERIGICGATSTPLWLMEEMRDYLAGL